MSKFKILLLFSIFYFTPLFAAEDIYPFTSAKDEKRFDTLIKEVRCVVCQNQNLAESSTPLAEDLRNKIYHMIIDQKKSDQEIEEYLVKRYGEYILLKPSFNGTNIILWILPFAIILIALYKLYNFN